MVELEGRLWNLVFSNLRCSFTLTFSWRNLLVSLHSVPLVHHSPTAWLTASFSQNKQDALTLAQGHRLVCASSFLVVLMMLLLLRHSSDSICQRTGFRRGQCRKTHLLPPDSHFQRTATNVENCWGLEGDTHTHMISHISSTTIMEKT